MRKKITALFLALILLLFCSVGCYFAKDEPMTNTYYGMFDSFVSVSSYSNDSKDAFDANCRLVNELLQYYNELFDIYNEYDGINNLCTVNKAAGKDAIKVDIELIDFIEYAISICKKCDQYSDGLGAQAMARCEDIRKRK